MKLKIPNPLIILIILLFVWAGLITYNNYRMKDLYVGLLSENIDLYIQNAALNYRLKESYLEILHLRKHQEQLLDTVKDTNRSFALLIMNDDKSN